MNLEKLGLIETRKISVDELLKEKPKQLPFLNPIEDEPYNFSMDINKVTVHDVRSHKMVYGQNYVIINFYNREGKLLVNLSAFGSNEFKEDEHFYIRDGSIMSETSLRVMNSDVE